MKKNNVKSVRFCVKLVMKPSFHKIAVKVANYINKDMSIKIMSLLVSVLLGGFDITSPIFWASLVWNLLSFLWGVFKK